MAVTRSKTENPPLGPIRTIALYREGVAGGERRVGGCGEREEKKKLLSYDIYNLCREAFPVQVFSP